MRGVRVLLCLMLAFGQLMVFTKTAEATDGLGIVISQVQVGNSSNSRLVELFNNSDEPIDITGWCVRYVSASAVLSYSGSSSMRACFDSDTVTQHLILPARSYLLVGSSQLGISADYIMTEGLGSGSSGKVYLVNDQQQSVDVFGWGNETQTQHAEGTPKVSEGNAVKMYERYQSVPGVYADTNNNNIDFYNSTLRSEYAIGSIVEVDDICQNLPEIQVLVPEGMILDEDWQCIDETVDLCENIEGSQLVLSPGMEVDDDGNCYQDACMNLPGFQDTVPTGFRADEQNLTCSLDLLPIQVTELLPNPDGDDKKNEFIELYNPNTVAVDLSYHVFHLGGDYVKTYSFPKGLTIEPQSYLAVYNIDISFTLTNTWSDLRLRSLDNMHVFDVPAYNNAESGDAWALINGVWQYTNRPTPDAPNEASSTEQELMTTAFLTDCGEGRERNPLTKRCRNIISSTSTVTPCKDGQYRSEETNRCRNISAASTKKPCKDNQYRSEETGRCRNITASAVPDVGFAVQPVKDTGMAFVGWWALGGLGLLAAGYGVWEWRREVTAFLNRAFRK